jgi:hypothetical protein
VRQRLLLAIFLVIVGAAGPALAQEPELTFKKVAIFPFTVLSKTPSPALGEKVRQDFADILKAEGFVIISPEELGKELAGLKEPLDEPRPWTSAGNWAPMWSSRDR